VEDHEMSRDMLCRRLQKRGFEVILAANGHQGIAMAKAEIPDLILMDICMPELDGISTIKCLKLDASTARIPIIALTALCSRAHVRRAIEAGCNQYETKPVHLERLLAKMHSLLLTSPSRE
jgi:DNA-binding response OmpR family regulator